MWIAAARATCQTTTDCFQLLWAFELICGPLTPAYAELWAAQKPTEH